MCVNSSCLCTGGECAGVAELWLCFLEERERKTIGLFSS